MDILEGRDIDMRVYLDMRVFWVHALLHSYRKQEISDRIVRRNKVTNNNTAEKKR